MKFPESMELSYKQSKECKNKIIRKDRLRTEGKEFAGAIGRWSHLNEECPMPEIIAVCDANPAALTWFTDSVNTVRYTYTDYRELLNNTEIQAIYYAVPHMLHKQIYVDIIESGKHFMSEKPFGIDKEANEEILEACKRHPESVVRCASEFQFYPACQKLIDWVEEGQTGRILEVKAGLNYYLRDYLPDSDTARILRVASVYKMS